MRLLLAPFTLTFALPELSKTVKISALPLLIAKVEPAPSVILYPLGTVTPLLVYAPPVTLPPVKLPPDRSPPEILALLIVT